MRTKQNLPACIFLILWTEARSTKDSAIYEHTNVQNWSTIWVNYFNSCVCSRKNFIWRLDDKRTQILSSEDPPTHIRSYPSFSHQEKRDISFHSCAACICVFFCLLARSKRRKGSFDPFDIISVHMLRAKTRRILWTEYWKDLTNTRRQRECQTTKGLKSVNYKRSKKQKEWLCTSVRNVKTTRWTSKTIAWN